MQRVEGHQIPAAELWQYDLNLDDYRTIASKRDREVDLFSHIGTPFNLE